MNKVFATALLTHINLLQAVADGKKIEWKTKGKDRWWPADASYLTTLNLTDQVIEFRVKPEPVVRKFYGTIRNDNPEDMLVGGWYPTLKMLRKTLQSAMSVEAATTHILEITSKDGELSAKFIPAALFKKENSANQTSD